MPRALVLCLLFALSPALGAGGPSTPREAFDRFLSAMVAVKQGEADRWPDAISCLDLDDVPPLVREETARRFATDLKTFLDKTERIEIGEIPLEVEGDRWIYLRRAAGAVALTRNEAGEWRFSQKTRESLPELLESVRGQGFVAGIEGGGGAPQTLADWLRGRLPDSMRGRVFLLENWQWLGLFGIILLGVIVDRLVRVVLGLWLRRLLRSSATLRDGRVDADFEKPVGFLAMALLWQALMPLLALPLGALIALKFAAQLMAAAGGVWAVYKLVDLIAEHMIAVASGTETKLDDILVPMLRRALKILVVAFGLLFIAQNLNINVTSLLAGLGIGGVAIALAAKDTVENLFGSVTVLVDRPFQIGDWVEIGDLEGTVEEIGFRSTRIRTFYNSLITFPNARLVNTAVDNYGRREYRRLNCKIGVQYDTPPEKIDAFCEGIRELIRRHPYARKDYYNVYFHSFADSSLNILLYMFFKTPDWTTELRERHRLLADVVRLAHRLGIEFAFPTQTLHVSSLPTVTTAPATERAPPSAGPAPIDRATYGDALVLGRDEARRIFEDLWGAEVQPPVDFADPERIKPGRPDPA